ncbi:MAG TPA: amylo-alpha-1,6-glucosidase [Thermoanaerobaculia bacterium]|nr:amylo-alpha-1,6-glucosidase [Thermoanaerobaculia bacterium]
MTAVPGGSPASVTGSMEELSPADAFDFPPGVDLERLLALEWIETNGIGGWASSTIVGTNTRRYHGLLVPALQPPLGRMVLLSRFEETAIDGDRAFALSSNRFPGVVHPEGWKLLRHFRRGPFPLAVIGGDGWTIRKTVAAIHGENTTVITYELEGDRDSLALELRPFLAARDYHALARANDSVRRTATFENGLFSFRMYDGVPELHLSIPGGSFHPAPDWYYSFIYEAETERGLDDREDLFTPGVLRAELRRGEPLAIVAAIDRPQALRDGRRLLGREAERRRALIGTATGGTPAASISLVERLILAADQFIVRRGDSGRSIIAGYHWFGDWGRDTMISLPGLCLTTGRFDDAKAILRQFASVVSEGMLPNRFPDGGDRPEYNTVDATLWFFIAIHRTIEATGDHDLGRSLLPVLEEIVAWHQRGTRHGIRVEEDGLLRAGEPGVQLTWMDAKVGDEVITPRDGKQVEINALWYNALRILAVLRRSAGDGRGADEAKTRAQEVQARFIEVFWNAGEECLYDAVDGENRDASIRPNQIFTISLPFPLLSGELAAKVLWKVEDRLLTPVGLRSLAREDPRYAPAYRGGPRDRDRVYHQGTVWSWLLGPYLTALVRVRGEEGRLDARRILAGFEPHLRDAGIGGISEIFDAEPPFAPRGCITQAWSVAEILRAAVEDAGISRNPISAERTT